MSHVCQVCGENAQARCTACKAAYYCSAQCQRQHWPQHKTVCEKAVAGAAESQQAGPTPAGNATLTSPSLAAGSSTAPNTGAPLRPAPPSQPKQGSSGLRPGWARSSRSLLLSARPVQPSPAPDALHTHVTPQPAPPQPAPGNPVALSQAPPSATISRALQPRPPSAPKPTPPAPTQPGPMLGAAPALKRPLPFLKRGFFLSQPTPKPPTEAAADQPQGSLIAAPQTMPLVPTEHSPGVQSSTTEAAELPSKTSPAQLLPSDVLTTILGLLPARSLSAAMQVCKEWWYVGSQPALWRSLISQLDVLLPASWTHPAHQHSQVHQPGSERASPSCPRPPASHLVAGVQSIRALRAGLPQPQGASRQGSARRANPGPPVHVAVGAALKQRANWQLGRYAEHNLHEHGANVECLAFVRTRLWGPALVSSSWDGAVVVHQLWPAAPAAPRPAITAACCRTGPSPSADTWAWSPHLPCNPTPVRRYVGHTGWVTSMAAGCEHVVTASTDKRVAIWNYRDQGPQPTGVVQHPREVTLVRFAYSGCETLVMTGCTDGSLRLIDMMNRQQLRLLEGHVDAVWGMCALPHNQLVTSSRDGCLRLWQLPELLRSSMSAPSALLAPSCQPSSQGTTVGALQTAPKPTDSRASRPWETVACTLPALMTAAAIARSPLGGDVLTTGPYAMPPAPGLPEQFMYSLCEHKQTAPPSTSTALRDGVAAPSQDELGTRIVPPARPPPHTVVLSPVAGSGQPGSASLITPVQVLQAHSKPVLCMDVVYCSVDGSSGTQQFPTCLPTEMHPGALPVTGGAAAGHGAQSRAGGQMPRVLVATGGADAVVQIWDMSDACSDGAAAAPVRTLKDHQHGVLAVKFGWLPELPDTASNGGVRLSGSQVVSRRLVLISGAVKQVKVWDPLVGTCLMILNDHTGPVTSIAISHEHVITLAMNHGLIVYSCNGVPALGQAGTRRLLTPVLELPDGAQRSFAAALAVCPQALAVGSSTGVCTLLDYTSAGSKVWLGPR